MPQELTIENLKKIRSVVMADIGILLLIIGAWFFLQAWLLPKLGVRT